MAGLLWTSSSNQNDATTFRLLIECINMTGSDARENAMKRLVNDEPDLQRRLGGLSTLAMCRDALSQRTLHTLGVIDKFCSALEQWITANISGSAARRARRAEEYDATQKMVFALRVSFKLGLNMFDKLAVIDSEASDVRLWTETWINLLSKAQAASQGCIAMWRRRTEQAWESVRDKLEKKYMGEKVAVLVKRCADQGLDLDVENEVDVDKPPKKLDYAIALSRCELDAQKIKDDEIADKAERATAEIVLDLTI